MDSLPEIPDYLKEMIMNGSEIDDIRIDKEGNWFHNGVAIENKRIINFFNQSISVTKDGEYVIHYDVYTYPISVEDVPVFVTGIRFDGFGPFEKIILNLSLGINEELNIETLEYRNNILYCRVKDGLLPAKFKRSPCFHILERLDERNGEYYLNICGSRIHLKEG